MSAETVAVVEGIYEAFAARDLYAVLARMSPDIVWHEAENFPYSDGNPYIGRDAVAAGVLARCIDEWDGFAEQVDELLDAGDTVVAIGRYHGIYKATGRPQNTQFVHVWRVRKGKAVDFRQFADTLHIAHVMAEESLPAGAGTEQFAPSSSSW